MAIDKIEIGDIVKYIRSPSGRIGVVVASLMRDRVRVAFYAHGTDDPYQATMLYSHLEVLEKGRDRCLSHDPEGEAKHAASQKRILSREATRNFLGS